MAGRGHAGRVPRTEPGDADYANDAVFAALAGRTDLVVALGREKKAHRAIYQAHRPRHTATGDITHAMTRSPVINGAHVKPFASPAPT